MHPDPAALLPFAHELADLAGPLAKQWFRHADSGIERKQDATPVTIADREIERVLRERIATAHPEHGILGEEHGSQQLDAEYVWVLDPIDGTKAFASGNPLFGTLIGLWHRGRPVLGVLDAPALGERYYAATGHGAHRRVGSSPPERLAVAKSDELSDAVLYCTTPDGLREHAGHAALRERVRWTSYGADCIAYALLAAGSCSLIVDTTLQPYDWCALVPIIEEAGGVVRDFAGNKLRLEGGDGTLVAAATAPLLRATLQTLTGGTGRPAGGTDASGA
ncbi:MAG: inositol monophosphatase family protein [Planctomycetota bacterium]